MADFLSKLEKKLPCVQEDILKGNLLNTRLPHDIPNSCEIIHLVFHGRNYIPQVESKENTTLVSRTKI